MGNKYRLEIKAKIVDMLKSVKQKRISKYIVLFMGFLVLLQAAPVFSVGLTCHSIDKLSLQFKKPAVLNKVVNKIHQITDNDYIKKLNERQDKYIDIKELELKTGTLDKFDEIRKKEYLALRPLVLQMEAKYIRLDEMDKKRCRIYDRNCKKELKKNTQILNDEIAELKKQIWHKKEYYKILYINETTRAQDIKLRRLIKSATSNNPKMW